MFNSEQLFCYPEPSHIDNGLPIFLRHLFTESREQEKGKLSQIFFIIIIIYPKFLYSESVHRNCQVYSEYLHILKE